ncbi:MAG: SprT-like domain-containing protein [Bacteroidales bacterium]|nr:SprT-like domain-containing protein [Bacteroidales bacterium]
MTEKELQILQRYFPEAAVPMVVEAYENSRFQLKFKKPRSSKLGDFRAPLGYKGICCITLNGNLNPYQMLVTFVHELAHYHVYMDYPKRRLEPHGEEWKQTFAQLLLPYLKPEIFPEDVIEALKQHLLHIKASSGADLNLAKVMKRYDRNPSGEKLLTVDDLPEGTVFQLGNGLRFKKGPKKRTRYQCECLDNGRTYSVSGLAEVK